MEENKKIIDINPSHENKGVSNPLDNSNSFTSFHVSPSSHDNNDSFPNYEKPDMEIEKLKLQIELAKLQSSIKSKPSEHHSKSVSTLIEDNQKKVKKRGDFFRRKEKTPIIPKEVITYENNIILKETSFKTTNVKKCPICNHKTLRSKVFMEDNKSCQVIKCKNRYCVYCEKIEW